MSIEKLNNKSKSQIEIPPFTQVLNFVTENIRDNDAFRVWIFCMSKSMDWIVIKEWTEKQCNVGRCKGKQIWSYLQRCKLIETTPIKNQKGKIIKWDLKVLCGMDFDVNVPFKTPIGMKTIPVELSTEKVQRYGFPAGGQTTRVVFRPLLNKELLPKKDFKRNKQKSFLHKKANNEKKHSFAASMNQNAIEARNIAEHEKIKEIEMGDRYKKNNGVKK